MEPPQVQASSSSNPNPGKEPEQLVREGAKAACLGGIKGCCSAFAKWACSILFGSNPQDLAFNSVELEGQGEGAGCSVRCVRLMGQVCFPRENRGPSRLPSNSQRGKEEWERGLLSLFVLVLVTTGRRPERFGKAISLLIMLGKKMHTQLLISHAFPNRSKSQCVQCGRTREDERQGMQLRSHQRMGGVRRGRCSSRNRDWIHRSSAVAMFYPVFC